MRINIVVAPPEADAKHVQPPIEAIWAATRLSGLGHAVSVDDLRVQEGLGDLDGDVICVVTQTYDRTQCYSLSLTKAQRTITQVRTAIGPDVLLVAAGVHGDIAPVATRAELGVPVLPGEMEESLPWLIEQLAAGSGQSINDLVKLAPKQTDVATLPTPDFSYVDLTRYRTEYVGSDGRVAFAEPAGMIFANRGCPYSCSYCFVWFGSRLRVRPPVKVLEDIRSMAAAGASHFFFLDYTFTVDRPWALELCRLIAESDLAVTWTCQTRCEVVDPEILSAMREAGCVGVFYGIELPWIADQDVQKRTKRSVIDQAVADTVRAGLHPFAFLLVGLGDTQVQVDDLIEWARNFPGSFSAHSLTPRPGTKLIPLTSSDSSSWDRLGASSLEMTEVLDDSVAVAEALRKLQALSNCVVNL